MPTKRIFGPAAAPSRLAMMGIRFIEGEGGAAPAAPAEPATPATPTPAAPAQDDTDWKAEARKWEERAKGNKTAADELAAIKDSQKSEAEKQAEQTEALRRENAELKSANLRSTVAAAKGIPAELLTGSTQEELEKSADALIQFRGEQPKPEPVTEPVPEKKTYFIPDEGGLPALGKADNISPGMGSLRAAYAQAKD